MTIRLPRDHAVSELARMPSPAGPSPLRVLLVETDEVDASRIRELVERSPVRLGVDWARSFDAGFNRMTSSRYDAHLVAARLDERSGVDLLRAYHAAGGGAPVLLLGGL
ncbi:hypothetical protein FBQ97_14330, partial [Acidobacteria bacterium ACD]|nr:hypothetical protein [Acidobacteria bacterium ACD]